MTPAITINGLTFYPVPEFTGPEFVIGAGIKHFFNRNQLPDIPAKFEDMASDLFYKGGQLPELSPLIDRKKAHVAVRAWLCSFAPAHESKIATVAYALWLWSARI